MIFIYRATRIFIKFYSKTFGRVTAAHWKWVKICRFALSVPPVCTEILSYLLLVFYWIFHPQGVTFWQFFTVRAHIRIFLAFRICINFYSILINEPARPHLPPKNLGAFSGQEIVYIGHFLWIKTWHFLHFVNLWPEGVIRDHFTTLRAWKTIDQAFQRHTNFWPRSTVWAHSAQRL